MRHPIGREVEIEGFCLICLGTSQDFRGPFGSFLLQLGNPEDAKFAINLARELREKFGESAILDPIEDGSPIQYCFRAYIRAQNTGSQDPMKGFIDAITEDVRGAVARARR